MTNFLDKSAIQTSIACYETFKVNPKQKTSVIIQFYWMLTETPGISSHQNIHQIIVTL